MKKALQISINKTLFTVEEDAYHKLEAYLSEVKEHFSNVEGKDEIIADIENRIAEQLADSDEAVITLPSVERILKSMGTIEDFDDSEVNIENKSDLASFRNKKLYRNPNDVIIAGVCSGLAAYFGWNVVWVRLVFALSVFLSGIGILLYIVLWLIVPEAKTKSQRLEMEGTPVTIETLSEKLNETVKDRVEEIKSRNGSWRSGLRDLIAFPFRILRKLIRGIMRILTPTIRILFGSFLILVSVVIFVSIMLSSGFFLSSGVWVTHDIPLESLLPGGIRLLVLAGLTLSIMIPAFFMLLSGISLVKKRNYITSSIGFGLLGVWFVALLVSGFGTSQMAANYKNIVNSTPEYQPVLVETPFEGEVIRNLKVSDGLSVKIATVTNDQFPVIPSLAAFGQEKEIARVSARVENGTLILEHKPTTNEHFCLFCFQNDPELTLSLPPLEDITLEHGSSLRLKEETGYLSSDSLKLHIVNGSYADLDLKTPNLVVELENGSHLMLSGNAFTANFTIKHGSILEAEELKTNSTSILASNGSNAEIYATQNLKVTAEHGSRVIYKGNPELKKSAKNGSIIESSE